MAGPEIRVLVADDGAAKVKQDLASVNRQITETAGTARAAAPAHSHHAAAIASVGKEIDLSAGKLRVLAQGATGFLQSGSLSGIASGLGGISATAGLAASGVGAAVAALLILRSHSSSISGAFEAIETAADGALDAIGGAIDMAATGFVRTIADDWDAVAVSIDGATGSLLDWYRRNKEEQDRAKTQNDQWLIGVVDWRNQQLRDLLTQQGMATTVFTEEELGVDTTGEGIIWGSTRGRGRGGGRRQGPRSAELFELGSGRSTGPQWGGGDDPSAFATGLDAVTTALGDMSAALLANAEDAKTWSDLSAAAHLHTERVATQSAAAQQAALMATYKATVGYTSATIGMVRTGVAGFLSEGAPKELFLGGADLAMAATATAEAFLMPTPGTVAAIGAYLFSSAQHFAMASQAGKGGAGARPSGGGGGGSSRPVTPAPVPRERSQSPAETILQLMVDDRVLGEVAARGNNRALAMGRGEALDSRLIGRARRGGI